jgi:SUN domain-containing protein 1/2
MKNENGHSRKASESRRRKKAEDGDMPYRPAEDDYAAESDGSEEEGEEGEGIVNGGALDGRASTRGKTKEKGEGYLGMGLGIQPRKRQGRKSGDQMESDEEGDRGLSPAPSYGHGRDGYSRSPTPAQLLRAITPRLSPGPRPLTPRRRQPSSLRTIITNILHGIVLALRFVTESIISGLDTAIIKPIRLATGSGKIFWRGVKKNWWKVLGGMLALSILLRLTGRSWSTQTGPISHGGIGFETEDLASRLSTLEQTIASWYQSSVSHSGRGSAGIDEGSQALVDRLTRLESSLAEERQRLDDLRGKSASVGQLRQDLDKVVARVDRHDSDIVSVSSGHQSVDRIEQELRGLRTRVDGVEAEVRNALDDGRLHKAIERILPEWMPIKRSKGGRIDIEQVFWNELKKVLVGKTEMDKAVQDALAGKAMGGVSERDLERFGDKLFEQKSAKGLIISRDQFLQAMGNELEDLKSRLDRAQVASPQKSSTITIKGDQGDDLVPLLHSLIDTAILKYSKDTLATPDYALYTAGARVVPSITSDTLVVKSASRLGKWVAGSKDVEGRAPATALHPDNSVGSCWPFNGSQGQLGILLSRRVVVTDVTIEHAAKELSPDVKTAPKAIEVVSDMLHRVS